MPPSIRRAMPGCRRRASASRSRRNWRCASTVYKPRASNLMATSWRTPSAWRNARNTVDDPPSPSTSTSVNGPMQLPAGSASAMLASPITRAARAASPVGSKSSPMASAASMRSICARRNGSGQRSASSCARAAAGSGSAASNSSRNDGVDAMTDFSPTCLPSINPGCAPIATSADYCCLAGRLSKDKLLVHACLDERAGEAPVAVDGAPAQPERFTDLLQAEPGEKAQLHDLGGARIGLFELAQRRIQRQRLLGGVQREFQLTIVQRDALPLPAGAQAQAVACAIDQQVAHGSRGIAEELG